MSTNPATAASRHDARLAAYLARNGGETVYGLALTTTVAVGYVELCGARAYVGAAGLRISAVGLETATVAPLFDSANTRWLYTVAALDAVMGNE